MERITEIDGNKIIQYDNSKSINFLDFIEFSNKFSSDISLASLSLYEYDMNTNFKVKNQKLFSLLSSLRYPLDYDTNKFNLIIKEIGEFFGFEEDKCDYSSYLYYQNFNKWPYVYNHEFKRYNTGRSFFDSGRVDRGSVIINLNVNHLEKTKENVLKAIKIFMGFYNKLNSSSEIKVMREGCFGNIKGIQWNELLVELEKEGSIFVKRTPKGTVRSIHFNDKKRTKNEEIMLKLESRGKLKKVSSDNNDSNHLYFYELYKFNIFPHLKTYLILKNNKFTFKVEYFSMKYGRNIMEDMGVWRDFKNSLNIKFDKKILVIEKFLDIEIKTKKITPLKYDEGYNGEASFTSKPFEISLK